MKNKAKNKTKRKYLGIALITLLCLTGAASAQARWGRGNCQMDWAGNQPGLNLTQDQTNAFNDLQSNHVGEVSSVRQAIIQKQLESDRLFLDASPDAAKLTALQKEISALQAQVAEKSLSYQLHARKLLTAEQLNRVPPGCNFGCNTQCYNRGAGNGYARQAGYGYDCGQGYGRGHGHGRGHRRGCRW
jgi:Spy/CpxP family protein refolding chaperone